jgi:hypothetical protein
MPGSLFEGRYAAPGRKLEDQRKKRQCATPAKVVFMAWRDPQFLAFPQKEVRPRVNTSLREGKDLVLEAIFPRGTSDIHLLVRLRLPNLGSDTTKKKWDPCCCSERSRR